MRMQGFSIFIQLKMDAAENFETFNHLVVPRSIPGYADFEITHVWTPNIDQSWDTCIPKWKHERIKCLSTREGKDLAHDKTLGRVGTVPRGLLRNSSRRCSSMFRERVDISRRYVLERQMSRCPLLKCLVNRSLPDIESLPPRAPTSEYLVKSFVQVEFQKHQNCGASPSAVVSSRCTYIYVPVLDEIITKIWSRF